MQQLAFDASTIQVQPAQFQQKGDKESAPDYLHCVFDGLIRPSNFILLPQHMIAFHWIIVH